VPVPRVAGKDREVGHRIGFLTEHQWQLRPNPPSGSEYAAQDLGSHFDRGCVRVVHWALLQKDTANQHRSAAANTPVELTAWNSATVQRSWRGHPATGGGVIVVGAGRVTVADIVHLQSPH